MLQAAILLATAATPPMPLMIAMVMRPSLLAVGGMVCGGLRR
jgi:hypothetical protein